MMDSLLSGGRVLHSADLKLSWTVYSIQDLNGQALINNCGRLSQSIIPFSYRFALPTFSSNWATLRVPAAFLAKNRL